MKNTAILYTFLLVTLLSTVSLAARLPTVGADADTWGDILNSFLLNQHNSTGQHSNITTENITVWNRLGIGTTTPIAAIDVRGNINLSGLLNATELWVSRTDVTANLSRLNVSSTLLESRQNSDNLTIGTMRFINPTYPIQGGGNLTANITITFDNSSYANLDIRQRADNASTARTNLINTFTANQIFSNDVFFHNNVYFVNNSNITIVNVSSLNVNGSMTAFSDNLFDLGSSAFRWQTLYAVSVIASGQGINNVAIVNTTGSFPQGRISITIPVGNVTGNVVNTVNAVTGTVLLRSAFPINITGNSTDLVFTFNNESLFNLDTRQRNDNASVARTNIANTFTATQTITGGLNATTFINATDVWASSRFNGSIDCKYLIGGTDADFCADANTGTGGGTGWTSTATLVYNDTAGVNVTIGTQNIASGYIMNIFGGLNVTQKINASSLWISRTDVTANLSALNISTTLLNDRLVSFNTSATTMNDRMVSFNTSATLMNDRMVLFNTSTTLMNDRLVSFNTSATAMNDRLVLLNTSATNLDTRQKNDNASIVRTDRNNFITGAVNVTTFINASEVWASRINASIDCKYIDGGSDANFCADATGAGGSNSTSNTDVVQSIAVGDGARGWGNITFINSSTINWTNTGSLINIVISALFRNESLSGLDTRVVSFNTSTTAMNDRLISFNTSATAMNDRLVSFNASATAMNDRLVLFNTSATAMNDRMVLFNTSATNLDLRQKNDNASQTSALNALSTNLSLFNQSATNLDTRQKNDNASIVRTNVGNTLTGNQFISGNLNVSALANLTNLTVNGLTLLNMNNLTGFNYTTNYALFAGNSINVSGLVNATQLLIYGTDVTLNLSRLNISTTLLNDRLVSFNTSATAMNDRLVSFNTSATAMNDRLVSFNTSATNLDSREKANNDTQATLIKTKLNDSDIPVCSGTDKLTRTAAGILLTCATDQTGGGGITNATQITDAIQSIAVGDGARGWGNITFINSSTINWTNTGSLINIVISALFRNESLANLDTRLVSFNTSATTMNDRLVLFNTSATNLDTRQKNDNASAARTNVGNIFTANQFITGNLNVSALTNMTNLTVNGLTLLSMNNLTGFNYSSTAYSLFVGTGINASGSINATQLLIYGTDVTVNLSALNISATLLNDRLVLFNTSVTSMNDRLVSFNTSATLMNDRLVSFNTSVTLMNDRMVSFNTSTTLLNDRLVLFNTSATNLDTRQKNDNASIARTNVGNFFTGVQNITGLVNATGLQSVNSNISLDKGNLVFKNLGVANTTQERWLDTNGRVVATRYWNGTALVLNVTG